MKLIVCKDCTDVLSLSFEDKKCSCGKSGGKYVDNLNAVYYGTNCVPLGFNNREFINSVLTQPETGFGGEFKAFVISKDCKTFKKINP